MNVYEVTIERKEKTTINIIGVDKYNAIDVASEMVDSKGWEKVGRRNAPEYSWSAKLNGDAEDILHPFLFQSNIVPTDWSQFMEETRVELVTEWLAKLGLPAQHASAPEMFRPVIDAIDQSIRALNDGLDLY